MVLIGSIIILYSLNPVFVFISIGSIPIYIILVAVVQQKMNARILKAKNKRDEFNATFIEQVSMSVVTKVYNLSVESIRRIQNFFDEKYNSRLKEFKIIYAFYSVEGLITMLVQIIFFGIGVSFISNGTMTIGEFSITLTLYAHIVRNIQYYLQLISKTEDFKVSYTRLNDLVNIPREQNNGKKIIGEIKTVSIFPITLEIDDATTLSYPKINMNTGDIIELSGDNGSGKTSFINILLGVYEVQRNKVFFNENTIEEINLNVIRNDSISYLMQDSLFLNDTVINNLDYFLREKKTPQEYIKLMKDKKLYFLIENYITSENPGQFFDRNIKDLSGGQRQKIALLTVLLKDYSLLILDEPLKGQDRKSKKLLYQYLQSIQKHKIILLVDHDSLFSSLCNKKIDLIS